MEFLEPGVLSNGEQSESCEFQVVFAYHVCEGHLY